MEAGGLNSLSDLGRLGLVLRNTTNERRTLRLLTNERLVLPDGGCDRGEGPGGGSQGDREGLTLVTRSLVTQSQSREYCDRRLV